MNKGVLLVNLGSPDSASVGDVRRFLNEFLMDRRVMDVPWPLRRLIVAGILIGRARRSALAYQSIWTPEGSPLIVTSRKVQAKLQERVTTVPVELAMRYRNPSIASALCKLVERRIDKTFLIPLFPHYAMSSYETAVARVRQVARKVAPDMEIVVQPWRRARPIIWRRAMTICCSVFTAFRSGICASATRRAGIVWPRPTAVKRRVWRVRRVIARNVSRPPPHL